MVALAALTTALSGLSSGASAVSSIFSGLGDIFGRAMAAIKEEIGKVVTKVKEKWQGVKDWWDENIQPIFDDIGDAIDGAMIGVSDAWDSLSVPAFFTSEYWSGEDGVFTKLGNSFDEKMAGISAYWDSISAPAVFTSEYWTGEDGVFTNIGKDFDILMAGISAYWNSLTISEYFTSEYWTGDDGVLTNIKKDFDILMGGISAYWNSLSVPAFFTSEYWTGEDGVFTKMGTSWDGAVTSIETGIENVKGYFSFDISSLLDFSSLFDGFSRPEWTTLTWWSDKFDIIISGLETSFTSFGKFLVNTFTSPIRSLIDGINSLFASINFSITIPNPLGDDYTVGMDLSSWVIPNIPMLAEGGIVTGPTLAMIGEAGPEAVIPLSGSNAGMGMGSTFNITINAGGMTDRTDKRQFARQISNEIQKELARTLGGSTMRSGR